MRKPTKALVAALLIGAVSVNADVVRTRGGGSGGAAAAITPGTTTVTGCQNRILYGDNSSVLNCEAALGYVASTDTGTIGNLTVSTALTNTALTSGRVTTAGTAGVLQDDADLTFSGTRLTATDLTVTNFPTFSAGTSTRVPVFGASGVVTDDADLTFTGGNTLVATNATVSTLLTIPAGTTAATGMLLGNDTDTFYGSAAVGNISLYTNNAERFRLDGSGNGTFTTSLNLGTITAPTLSFGSHATNVAYVASGIAGTSRRFLMGGGASVASAATLPAPTGSVFHVTGTTNITGGITTTNLGTGVQITLIFDGILTVSSGGNLIIVGGTFVTTANDTLTLVYDGTSFFEIARTVL